MAIDRTARFHTWRVISRISKGFVGSKVGFPGTVTQRWRFVQQRSRGVLYGNSTCKGEWEKLNCNITATETGRPHGKLWSWGGPRYVPNWSKGISLVACITWLVNAGCPLERGITLEDEAISAKGNSWEQNQLWTASNQHSREISASDLKRKFGQHISASTTPG